MTKNIFVMGLEPFNHALLKKVRSDEPCRFHKLLDFYDVAEDPDMNVDQLLDQARRTLDRFSGSIDAIVGYWDFPTVALMPILRKEYGLHGPSLESVLKCEHKYWSRVEEEKALPQDVPRYGFVDPFEDGADDAPPLDYPFWIKPVMAHSSMLGFKADNDGDYRDAIAEIREGIDQFAPNVDRVMRYAKVPKHVGRAGGRACVAEDIISAGKQCTLEGYVYAGKPEVYGIIDTIRGPNKISLARYQYPSALPRRIKNRMVDAAKKLAKQVGLDYTPFNIEFFWNPRTNHIWILEINSRMSKSHSPMFELVEGAPHKQVMVDVALGRKPEFPFGDGPFRHAAKFMLRRYDLDETDQIKKAPTEKQIKAIEDAYPGCRIKSHVKKGMCMADLPFQDSYSYELAEIHIGAASKPKLMVKYREIVERMDIRIGGDT